MIHEIIEATSFIFLLVWLMSLASKFWLIFNIKRQIISGLAFGLIAIISMIDPSSLGSGILLDPRMIVISVATFFGGLTTGLITALIAGLYRLHLGGNAAPTGIFLMIIAVILSWLASQISAKVQKKYQWLIHLLLAYTIFITVIFVVKETLQVAPNEEPVFFMTTLLVMPIGLVLVFFVMEQSIQKNKSAREMKISEERLRGISEAIPDLLIILDEEGRYMDTFGTDETLLTQPKADLIGKTLKDVLPPEKADFFLIWIKSVLDENTTKETEYTLETMAGLKYFEARASAMKSTYDGKRAVAILTRDITKYKQPSAAS